ncbi:MAG: flagellar biosynthetic protein FliO [Lachnospiraceae bacterium]|nr:flagellar biosynthetic protein FliO [Lachnospiraceae bacterium]
MIFLLADNVKNELVFNSSGSNWKLLGLIILCAVIIAACYYTTRFIGKRSGGGLGFSRGRNIRVIETFRITQKQFLQLIRCGDKYLLISISKDNITLLSEIDVENIELEEIEAEHKSFKDIISSLRTKKDNKEK